jgi:tetrapyrrole methylase family protein / MazG family protein
VSEFRDEDLGKFETLLTIMDRLREPGGCPWDREQTRKTLRSYVLEEAYETVQAIDAGDEEDLKEELGDLLLQIVFQARIGVENGTFTIEDVIRSITTKLIRRHPHVFGDTAAADTGEVLRNWNAIKLAEKGSDENRKREQSILEGVPEVLPALLKAVTYSRRAAQVGFDWDKPKDVMKKLHEEIHELEKSLAAADPDEIEDEMGDVFFVMANLARHLNVNPELALERANRKFKRRFAYVERTLAARGSSPQESSLEEMDALWDEAKVKLPEETG